MLEYLRLRVVKSINRDQEIEKGKCCKLLYGWARQVATKDKPSGPGKAMASLRDSCSCLSRDNSLPAESTCPHLLDLRPQRMAEMQIS